MVKKAISILMMSVMLVTAAVPAQAAKVVTTPTSKLPKETDVDRYKVTVNSDNGTRTFRIFSQGAYGKNTYIRQHGCAACSLTTVLSGYTKKYANYTPAKTCKILEKKVFGTRVWRSNYSKSPARKMPVSLYGITRVLKSCGIKSKYVRFFSDNKAINEITSHLKTGNAVIIEVNNHTQKNGKISSAYNSRWATSKHTMVLLGMTNTGKAIVADSAYRTWSGSKQRVKYAKVSELVKYMIPCKRSSTKCYYTSVDVNGGYILVN